MKFRTRVHYASWVVAGVTALWLGVVFEYSIATLRRVRRVEKRFDSLERSQGKYLAELHSATNALAHMISVSSSSSVSFPSLSDEELPPSFEPRLIGRGQSRSPSAIYVYEDWEVESGVSQRRYVARIPLVR